MKTYTKEDIKIG